MAGKIVCETCKTPIETGTDEVFAKFPDGNLDHRCHVQCCAVINFLTWGEGTPNDYATCSICEHWQMLSFAFRNRDVVRKWCLDQEQKGEVSQQT